MFSFLDYILMLSILVSLYIYHARMSPYPDVALHSWVSMHNTPGLSEHADIKVQGALYFDSMKLHEIRKGGHRIELRWTVLFI